MECPLSTSTENGFLYFLKNEMVVKERKGNAKILTANIQIFIQTYTQKLTLSNINFLFVCSWVCVYMCACVLRTILSIPTFYHPDYGWIHPASAFFTPVHPNPATKFYKFKHLNWILSLSLLKVFQCLKCLHFQLYEFS